ncbi:CRM1 C terminal-domain-containing protein [Histomonas meleagridis]|uniref:CRM1 C terminal-domain-containing protein n=1 Tax=Histomonas meleagridis TaxID=135588 RepID=UPI00355990B6|nr:CRM1 C terminal-domain-containing protein [Histomonas meleagridis]KAH0806274.1 CRM1 C terminal-domain-containing protein [Histomonas meleagridis]
MTVTIESIVNAAQIVSQGNVDGMQGALELLNAWESDDNCILIACEVISKGNDPSADFFAATIMDHKIPFMWNKIDDETKEPIRQLIYQKMHTSNHIPTIYALCRSLSHIALYEWPEIWEGFSQLILPEEDTAQTFALLESFLNDIEESPNITENRRQSLRNQLRQQQRAEKLYLRIQNALNNPDFHIPALSAFSAILSWCPMQLINGNVITLLCTAFLANRNTIDLSLKCLTTIFLKRTDSVRCFHHHYSILLETFATVKYIDSEQSITTYNKSIIFLQKIFYKYLHPLFSLLEHIIGSPMAQHLNHLFQVILSLPTDLITRKFWLIWSQIGIQLTNEQIGSDSHMNHISPFFLPLIGSIRQSLYLNLQFAINEDGILQEEARNCWAKWVEYDYQTMFQFLGQQNPSPSLCYALGCQELVRASTQEMGEINTLIQELLPEGEIRFDSTSSDNSKYHLAFLYGLSRASTFLFSMDLFPKFIEYCNQCLQDSNEHVCNAASYAYLYTAQHHPELFIKNEMEFTEELISQTEFFIHQLSRESSIRMYQCIISILQTIQSDSVVQYYQQMFKSVSDALSDSNGYIVETSLIIISECANLDYLKDNERKQIYQKIVPFIYPQVLNIAKIIIPDQTKTPESIDCILNTIFSCFYALDFDTDKQRIYEIIDLCLARQQILPSYFTFLCNLRQIFPDLGESWEQIYNCFILPALQYEPPLLSEVLTLISRFKGSKVDFDWFIRLCIEALTNFDREINISSVKALIRVFRELDTPVFYQLLNTYGVELCSAIFFAMFDSMHKSVFDYYSKLLFKICSFLVNQNMQSEEWLSLIIGSLQRCEVEEPEEGLFVNFTKLLNRLAVEQNKDDFQQALKDFLIVMNRVSPGDEKLFSSKKFRMNDILFNGGGMIQTNMFNSDQFNGFRFQL